MNHDSGDSDERHPTQRSNFWLVALAVLLVFLLLGELWRRIGQASELRALQDRLAVQVTVLAGQADQLDTSIASARSDQAVAQWARSQGKMARPGEVLVQPVTPAGATPSPPAPASPPQGPANWRIWWEWLWGQE
jgi:cell division protein FtsB